MKWELLLFRCSPWLCWLVQQHYNQIRPQLRGHGGKGGGWHCTVLTRQTLCLCSCCHWTVSDTRGNLMVIGKDLIQEECLIHLATWGSGWVKLALSPVTRVLLGGCSCTWELWQTKLKIRVSVSLFEACPPVLQQRLHVYVCPAGSCVLDTKHAARSNWPNTSI